MGVEELGQAAGLVAGVADDAGQHVDGVVGEAALPQDLLGELQFS